MNRSTITLASLTTAALSAAAIADPVVVYEGIARSGEQAADQPVGVTYKTMAQSAVINSQGHVAFRAVLEGTGITDANDVAIYFWDGTASHLVVQEGDAVPNVAGLAFAELNSALTLNDSDEIAALCVASDGFESVLFADSAQSPSLAAWSGGPFNWFSAGEPRMNNVADLLIEGRIGCFCLCDYELAQGPAGGLAMLLPACSTAPDLGEEIGSFNTYALSQTGNVAYSAALNVAHDRNAGFVPDGVGGMTSIGRDDDPAPGLPGETLRFANAQFNLNSGDEYVVVLSVTDATSRAVYCGAGGTMDVLVREGATAPGGGTWNEPTQAQINESGEIVVGCAGVSGFFDGAALSTVALGGENSVFLNEPGQSVYSGIGVSGLVEVWLRDIDGALAAVGDVSAGPIAMLNGGALDADSVHLVGEAIQGRHAGGPQAINDIGQMAVMFQMPTADDRAIVRATARCKVSDLDGNRTVDGADLAALLSQWGGAGSADLTGDGTVDGADLAVLLAEWGACS